MAPELMPQEPLNLVLRPLHNEERARRGQQVLRVSWALQEAALRHCLDMATRNFLGHTGSDGTSPWDRIRAAGYVVGNPPHLWCNENAGAGHISFEPSDVFAAWMASSGHRANILTAAWDEVGFAGYWRRDLAKNYMVTCFGRSSEPPPGPSPGPAPSPSPPEPIDWFM